MSLMARQAAYLRMQDAHTAAKEAEQCIEDQADERLWWMGALNQLSADPFFIDAVRNQVSQGEQAYTR